MTRQKTRFQQPVSPEDGDTQRALVVLTGVSSKMYLSLREAVRNQPYSLKMVQGGFELIDAFGHVNVNVVALNDPLPDFSIDKLLKRARRFPGLANAMFLMISEKASDMSVDKLFEEGIDKVLLPPVTPEAFISAVNDLLSGSKGTAILDSVVDLAGNLNVIGIVEVLQLLNAGRKTGTLDCNTRRGACNIYISNGEIVFAQFGPVQGKDAVFAIMKESIGHFSFKLSDAIASERNVEMNFASLLLEGMRRNDEVIRQSSSKFMVQSGGAKQQTETAPTDDDEVKIIIQKDNDDETPNDEYTL